MKNKKLWLGLGLLLVVVLLIAFLSSGELLQGRFGEFRAPAVDSVPSNNQAECFWDMIDCL